MMCKLKVLTNVHIVYQPVFLRNINNYVVKIQICLIVQCNEYRRRVYVGSWEALLFENTVNF